LTKKGEGWFYIHGRINCHLNYSVYNNISFLNLQDMVFDFMQQIMSCLDSLEKKIDGNQQCFEKLSKKIEKRKVSGEYTFFLFKS